MLIRYCALAAALLAAIAIPAVAHQDTLFRIAEDGLLDGVPDEFQPASLRIEKSKSAMRVSLEVSGNVVDLPACIANLFDLPAGQEVRVSGSWYHSRSLLPAYVGIDLPRRTKPNDPWLFEGHQLMFNLETAELIHLWRSELTGTGAIDSPLAPSEI